MRLFARDSGHRPCRLFRGGFLGGRGYTRWNRTVWVVRSGVFETEEAGCGARVKSLSTWLRAFESYSRKRVSMFKALPAISKYLTRHYPTPPGCLPIPPLCYLHSSFLMRAPPLCLPIASLSLKFVSQLLSVVSRETRTRNRARMEKVGVAGC